MRAVPAYLFLTFFLLSLARPLRASGFNETTTGSVQESSGGISDDEVKQLDDTQKNLFEKFRRGRVSSFKDVGSRYSGHLEMHDEDLNGITDHNLRKGQVNMEGQMDKSAFGDIISDPNERERQQTGSDATNKKSKEQNQKEVKMFNAGNCKEGYVGGKPTNGDKGIACRNISANVLDAGPAHGKDDPKTGDAEEHRFYKVSDAAIKGAEEAGGMYADRAAREAKSFDAAALNRIDARAQVNNVGPDKSRIQYQRDGKTVQAGVSGEIDYLRSEYAWLEEQKKHRLDQNWKTIRASRLGGLVLNDSVIDRDGIDPILANKVAANRSDDEIAQFIAEKRTYEHFLGNYCVSTNGAALSDCSRAPGKKLPAGVFFLKDFLANESIPEAQKAQKWKEAIEDIKKSLSDDKKSEVQKIISSNQAQIKKCLERDTWCMDPMKKLEKEKTALKAKAQGNPGALDQIERDYQKKLQQVMKDRAEGKMFAEIPKGQDVGNAFSDTREFVNARASAAWGGPVDRIVPTMYGADFNSRIDSATAGGAATSRPYQEMVQQVQAIQKMQADLKKQRDIYSSGKVVNVQNVGSGRVIESYEGYQGTFKFNDQNFNTATQSTMQMFGINRARDGASLDRSRGPAANNAARPLPPNLQRPPTAPLNPPSQGKLGAFN